LTGSTSVTIFVSRWARRDVNSSSYTLARLVHYRLASSRGCDGEADEDVDRFDELLAWFDAWTGGVDDPEFVTRLIEWNAIIDAM
jgi:hypothetical protein